jgi:hypothetical protein
MALNSGIVLFREGKKESMSGKKVTNQIAQLVMAEGDGMDIRGYPWAYLESARLPHYSWVGLVHSLEPPASGLC